MTKLLDGMRWFKATFGAPINASIAGTVYNLNFMTAIGTQETFEVWGLLFETNASVARILELCVGDTIDAPSRSVFPVNKSALVAIQNGPQLFQIARAALEDVATVDPDYARVAAAHPDKFCHGFGVFQYDIQHCRNDSTFFLQRQWGDPDVCIAKCLGELSDARRASGLQDKPQLTDLEMAYVAIAYNCGSFNPKRGLKQGFRDQVTGKYYGEMIYSYIEMAAGVPG